MLSDIQLYVCFENELDVIKVIKLVESFVVRINTCTMYNTLENDYGIEGIIRPSSLCVQILL